MSQPCAAIPAHNSAPRRAKADPKLKVSHFRVLLCADEHDRFSLYRAPRGQGCTASATTIANETGLHVETVKQAVRDLVAWGYLATKSRGNGHQRTLAVVHNDQETGSQATSGTGSRAASLDRGTGSRAASSKEAGFEKVSFGHNGLRPPSTLLINKKREVPSAEAVEASQQATNHQPETRAVAAATNQPPWHHTKEEEIGDRADLAAVNEFLSHGDLMPHQMGQASRHHDTCRRIATKYHRNHELAMEAGDLMRALNFAMTMRAAA